MVRPKNEFMLLLAAATVFFILVPKLQNNPRVQGDETVRPEHPFGSPRPLPSFSPRPDGRPPFKIGTDKLELEDSSSVSATSRFPLHVDATTGGLFVRTGDGEKQIRILPGEAAAIATQSGVQNEIEKIELNQGEGTPSAAVFSVTGRKTGKLFGLFDVSEPVTTQVDAGNGQVVSTTNESFFFRLFSAFIR